jgi:hypothetical protein
MIHKPAVPRIEEQPNGEDIMHILQGMIDEAEEEKRTCGQLCVPFIDENDEFEEGTWVPEFWFVVRKVLP